MIRVSFVGIRQRWNLVERLVDVVVRLILDKLGTFVAVDRMQKFMRLYTCRVRSH